MKGGRDNVNSSEGAVWLGHVGTHTVTGEGGERRMRRTKRRRRSIGPRQRGRLQHVGFDRMAPPGTGNTKPCDYPKHTGSDWVSEPAPFPTLLLWTVWDTCLCCHSAHSIVAPSPQSRLGLGKQTFTHHLDAISSSSVQFSPKYKRINKLLTCSGSSRQLDT